MTKVGSGLIAGFVTVFAPVVSAQAAPAPVYLDGTVLRYLANDGQTNVVSVSSSGGRIVVKDTVGLTAGDGCRQTNPTTVSCERPTGTFKVDLLDGNDVLTNSTNLTVVANGGPGNDVFNGSSSASEALIGDDGDDVLNGAGGNDFLSGGAGNDVINGGDGDDRIDDTQGGNDVISGGAGNDQIQDNEGVDTISGDAGDDTIYSLDDTKDTINCGAGNDSYGLDQQDIRTSCEKKLN